ncbi:MAG: hypothetical protein R6U98_10095 [Pirellulaceae bacterium]
MVDSMAQESGSELCDGGSGKQRSRDVLGVVDAGVRGEIHVDAAMTKETD